MSDARFSYSQDDFKRIAQFVLDHAKANGASAADTEVSEGFGQTVTVRNNEIETVEYNKDKGVGVTVYMGHRKGHASTSDLSDAALKATVEKPATIARHTAEDEAAGLPDRDWLATDRPELDLFHPWDIDVEQAAELAKTCEAAAFRVDRRIENSEGASVFVTFCQVFLSLRMVCRLVTFFPRTDNASLSILNYGFTWNSDKTVLIFFSHPCAFFSLSPANE